MINRKKIAVFVDYSIRIPNFQQSYQIFKDSLFKDNFGINSDEETAKDEELKLTKAQRDAGLIAGGHDKVRFYWQKELEQPEIMKFYMGKNPETIKDDSIKGTFKDWFFNTEHLRKFLEEYSFNMYSADCIVPNKQDIAIINIAQTSLFDVHLFDRVYNSRKIRNTLHFLSKNAVVVRSITFLNSDEEFDNTGYLGVWDPSINNEQLNKEGSTVFLEWFKELESKSRRLS